MIPGTISRKNASIPRGTEDSQPAIPAEAKPETRQTAAEPWREDSPLSRREYFRSLLPGIGALLVRGLRDLEQVKRNLQDRGEK